MSRSPDAERTGDRQYSMNALQNLTKLCESKGITLVFSHVNEQPMKVMKNPLCGSCRGRKFLFEYFGCVKACGGADFEIM